MVTTCVFEPTPFAEGRFRWAYRGIYTAPLSKVGGNCVVKRFKESFAWKSTDWNQKIQIYKLSQSWAILFSQFCNGVASIRYVDITSAGHQIGTTSVGPPMGPAGVGPPMGLAGVGPPNGASRCWPPNGASRCWPPNGASRCWPPNGASRCWPPNGASRCWPPNGASRCWPPNGASRCWPPNGASRCWPPNGASRCWPPNGASRCWPPNGASRCWPPNGASRCWPPNGASRCWPPNGANRCWCWPPNGANRCWPPNGDNSVGPPMGTTVLAPPMWTTGVGPPMWTTGVGPPMWTTGVGPPMWTTGVGPPMESISVAHQIGPKLYEFVCVEDYIPGEFTKWCNNYGYISPSSELMPAFMHWSWVNSGGQQMIADLQGVRNDSEFILTDPAIMSNTVGGDWYDCADTGIEGIAMFFLKHSCNKFGNGLPRPIIQDVLSTPNAQSQIASFGTSTAYSHELQILSDLRERMIAIFPTIATRFIYIS